MRSLNYDLIVVGGGFAGAAAAIAAAREGLSVLLVEKGNALGGAAANCLVNPFMKNRTKINGEMTMLSRGLFLEIIDEMKKLESTANVKAIMGDVFSEEYLKIVLNDMVINAGVNLLFHSFLVGVNKDGSNVKSVVLNGKSGEIECSARYFIDATGDGDLAALAGCPYRLGREQDNLCQPMTLCFRVIGVDHEAYAEERKRINQLYAEKQAKGDIKNLREDVLVFRNVNDGVLHFNSTRIVKLNPTDVFDLTRAEIDARKQVLELLTFLKENFEAFKDAQLLATAANIGVRESRMIDGEYVLTGEDLMSCVKFDDTIAFGNYDLDIHNPEGSGTSHYYFKEGEYYTIPYRSLVPKAVDNLLVTGRCISATHEAQVSIRILPIVCCLGEASGTAIGVAAAACVATREVDVAAVQEKLKGNNAFV